jgi:hypothetical protein
VTLNAAAVADAPVISAEEPSRYNADKTINIHYLDYVSRAENHPNAGEVSALIDQYLRERGRRLGIQQGTWLITIAKRLGMLQS